MAAGDLIRAIRAFATYLWTAGGGDEQLPTDFRNLVLILQRENFRADPQPDAVKRISERLSATRWMASQSLAQKGLVVVLMRLLKDWCCQIDQATSGAKHASF